MENNISRAVCENGSALILRAASATWLAWLRQSQAKPNSRHTLEHIERLKAWQARDLPAGIERQVHQNRLLNLDFGG